MVIRGKSSGERVNRCVLKSMCKKKVHYRPRITGHGWDVKCVEWHPTKGLLVSGSKDNQIKFWDPRTGTTLSTLYATCSIFRLPIPI